MANLDIIIRAQNLASGALRQVESQLQGIQRQSTFAERGFGGLQRAVGTGMVAAAGAAVAGVGALAVGLAKSVTAAADFESQINVLTVAAASSGTTMADLSAAALKVGADSDLVGISASEAADAMTNFYKAGLSTNEIFADMQGYLAGTVPLTGALRAAIDLAAASELNLAAASDVVAVAMATFGLEAADAARIADTLVGAADASLASVSGLAEGMKNVGAIAGDLDDTATALAILSTRGIQGAEAGTALKSMMLNLRRPTKDVRTALDELGVSLYNTDGTMKALPDVIGQLEGALSGLTEEQRNQYAVTLAGSYGLNAFNVLVGEGTAGWNEMAGSIATAATAQEVAAARTKGFNAAMEQMQGALESFMITVGTPLIQEFLTPAIQKMGDVISQLTTMVPSVEQVRAAYDKLVERGKALLSGIQAVIGPIAEAIGQFVSWKDVLIALGIVVASIVLPFLWGIVTAATPVIAVFGALVGAVALIRNAWEKDWGGIREKTQAVIDYLQPALDRLKSYLDMIKGGDWSGLVNAVFADVGAMLSSASATIAAFDWADWIDGALDWAAYIGQLAWDGFLTLLDWQVYVWKLEWSAFVSALDWAAGWVTSLDWGAFVATLSDWGTWISSLDWTKIITTVIDWATWIPALTWNSFVAMLDWATIVVALAWTEWLSKLTWADFVSALSWGSDKVSSLKWSDFVAVLDWVGKIAEFAWDSFVSKLDWPLIAEFDWGSWIDSFNWPRLPSFSWSSWISSFNWPSLPSFSWSSWISGFSWPSLPSFSWSSFIPTLQWPSIPEFKWPTINLPSIPGFATGTAFAPGGMALVGERGPELAYLPRGTRIESSERTSQVLGGGGVTVNVYATVSNQMDMEELAYRVAQTIQRRQR
ncbi:MAG: phage tail tape measure protein [Caldilineaceae bacterium]|nr:phage tail tape measure protein [Caldilineaceae bacterium]